MPTYQLTSPKTGRVYNVDATAELPDDDIDALVNDLDFEAAREAGVQPGVDPAVLQQGPVGSFLQSIPQTFSKVGSGMIGGAGRILDKASESLSQATGLPKGGDMFQRMADYGDELSTSADLTFPTNPQNPVAGTIGSGAAQGLSLLAGGLAGKALTGSNVAMTAVPAASGFLSGANQGIQTAEQIGVQSPLAQLGTGMAFGGLEVLTERLGGIGSKAGTEALTRAVRQTAGQMLRSSGKAVGSEALEEVLAGRSQAALTRLIASEDPNNPGFTRTGVKLDDLASEIVNLEAMKLEALGGAAGGTVFAGVQALANRQLPNDPTTSPNQTPAPTQSPAPGQPGAPAPMAPGAPGAAAVSPLIGIAQRGGAVDVTLPEDTGELTAEEVADLETGRLGEGETLRQGDLETGRRQPILQDVPDGQPVSQAGQAVSELVQESIPSETLPLSESPSLDPDASVTQGPAPTANKTAQQAGDAGSSPAAGAIQSKQENGFERLTLDQTAPLKIIAKNRFASDPESLQRIRDNVGFDLTEDQAADVAVEFVNQARERGEIALISDALADQPEWAYQEAWEAVKSAPETTGKSQQAGAINLSRNFTGRLAEQSRDDAPGFQHLVIDRDLEAGFMSGAGADALIDLAHRAFAAGRTFAQWAAAMVQRFGAAVRDYLAAVWDHAKRSSQTGALNFTSRLGEQLQQSQQAASRLRKPANRATPAAMASDPGAAQNAEPSPGGLSEALDYHMSHRPDAEGARLHDLLETDQAPKDIYTHPHYTFSIADDFGKESWRAIKAARGKPDGLVTIYRAAPKGAVISNGDWVTLSKKYAESHSMRDNDPANDLPVLSLKVPAKFVRWAGDDVNEFGYFPSFESSRAAAGTSPRLPVSQSPRLESPAASRATPATMASDPGAAQAAAAQIAPPSPAPSALAQQWWASTSRAEARAILQPASLEELKAIAVRMDENPNQSKAKLIDRLVQITGVYADAVGIRGADVIGPRGPMPDYTGQTAAAQQRMREQKAARAQQPKERGLPKAKPRTPEEFARDMAALMTTPGRQTVGTMQSSADLPAATAAPLKAAYASALRGSSTAMVPLADVFAAAQAANPALTQEQFQAQVMADYEAGSLMLEGAGSPQEAQNAGLRIDGTPVGTAVRMMVPQGFTHLDVSGQRSQAGFVINPLPALQRLAARVLPLHERGEPFRVKQLGARAILTGSPLPSDVTQVLAMTENERQAVAQSAAQVGRDLQAAVKTYLDRTGQDERATWDKINAVMEGQPGALTLLTAIDPALGERSRRARNMLDDLSAAVAQTLPTGSLRDAITQNQGSWMRRGYAAFDPESGWNFDGLTKAAKAGRQIGGKDAAKILANARAYLRSQNPQNGRTLKEWNADIEADMRDLMDRNAWQSANLGGNTLRKNVSSFMRRKEIAPEIRALMGEETNPLHRFIKSAAFQAQIVARHHGQTAVRALGLQTELFSTQRGGVYTEEIEPSENRWSGLAGVWTTPKMKAALANSSAVNREGTDLGGWLVGTVKALGNEAKLNRVALNPDSWVVNILGNVVGLVQSGDVFAWDFARRLTDARALIKSGKARPGSMQTAAESALIDAQRAMLARLRGMGVIGSSITLADIEASIPRHLLQWVAEDRARNTGLGAVKGAIMGQAAGRGLGLPGRVVGGVAGGIGGAIAGAQRLQNWQQNVADYVMTGPDALARVTGWLTNYETALAAGQNPDQAAADATTRTLNTFPNYNALPALLRQLSRLGFTGSFIAFQWEVYRNFGWNVKYAIEELSSGNAAIQARGLRRLAGIGSVAALAGGGLAALLGAAGAAASDDEERNKIWRQWFAAPWEKDAVLAFDKYDKQGVSYYNTSYLLPQMTMMELIQGASEGRDPADSASRVLNRLSEQFIAGSVHLQPLLSAFANQDRFGRRITNAEGLAGAAARVDVAAQTILEPGFADKITRLTYALRQAEKNGRKFSVEEEMKRLAGIRQVSRTWEELVKRRYSQFTYDYQGVRDDANKMLGQNLPGAPVRAVKMVNDKVIELEQQLADYERDLRRLGVPETTIKAAKKDSSLQRLNPVRVRADGRRVEAVTVR